MADKQAQPVVKRAAVAAVVTVVVGVLGTLGVQVSDGVQSFVIDAATAAAPLAALLWAAYSARKHVTPSESPRDEFGRDLTPDVPADGPEDIEVVAEVEPGDLDDHGSGDAEVLAVLTLDEL